MGLLAVAMYVAMLGQVAPEINIISSCWDREHQLVLCHVEEQPQREWPWDYSYKCKACYCVSLLCSDMWCDEKQIECQSSFH